MVNIGGVDINYDWYENKKKHTLVFLHGWGQNISMMEPIAKPFMEECNVLIIDLPGFGSSSEPPFPWEVKDYVEMLKELLTKLKIKKPILIGHSFGGRVSIMYAGMYEVEKLILLAAPFKKEIKKDSLKTKTLKSLKKVPGLKNFEEFAKKHIGSEDYKNASKTMREILVNTVNYDLEDYAKKIKCPTILIWGTNDEAVSLERAYELESLIHDAAVIEYEGCTHYAYLERCAQTISIIDNFIRE